MARKILILEDNEEYSSILVKKLTLEEFDVSTAKDGKEAINLGDDYQPDIVIIDLLLPDTDGIRVMEEFRKKEWGKKIPLLILTNLNPDEEIHQKIIINKPADYLIKPEVTIDKIVERIRLILQNPQKFT